MSWQDRAEQTAFRSLIGGLKALPDKWSVGLCRELGFVAGPVLGIRRNTVRSQLVATFPDLSVGEINHLVSGVYRHLGHSLAETFCIAPDSLLANVSVAPNWDRLDTAMQAGRGVIAVTAHFGNFELGGRMLAQRYPVLDVVKPMRNGVFGDYLKRERARHGIETVPMAESGRAVVAHLRSGGLVTLLLDQDAGKEGVQIDFLGRPASTWSGAARLALRTGCPIIPLAIVRQEDDSHILHIGEPVAVDDLTQSERDVITLTQRCSQAVEGHILKNPVQWFWVHRRWKGASEAQTV